jgi:hypothetical protein
MLAQAADKQGEVEAREWPQPWEAGYDNMPAVDEVSWLDQEFGQLFRG